jgi:hypothetical protein
MLLAGSEAYSAGLAFYETSKAHAKRNVAGAGTIADDLASSLPARGPRPTSARGEDTASDEAH